MKGKILIGAVSIVSLGFIGINTFETVEQNYQQRNFDSGTSKHIAGGEYLSQLRSDPLTGTFSANNMSVVAEKVKNKMNRRSSIGLKWNELGPYNVGGRTRSILIDKDNSKRIYAGSVTGGLYISDNAGGTWRAYNDLMENLAISTIVQSSNGDIYVGTGNQFDANGSDSQPGGGIFKSNDGGKTFVQLKNTAPKKHMINEEWSYVNKLAVDPKNPEHVYAATKSGLKFSSDGGNTWESKFGLSCGAPSQSVDDVTFSTNGRVFFVMGKQLYFSDNPSGDFCSNYVKSTKGWKNNLRTVLASCKQDPDIVYAIQVDGQPGSSNLAGIVKSTDGGLSWSNNEYKAPSSTIDSTISFLFNSQGYYDLAFEVYPNDCDRLLIGGVQMYEANPNWKKVASTNLASGSYYVHADLHYFVFDPKDPNTLYIGGDGGVGKSTNAGSDDIKFVEANRGYVTSQFYGVAFSPEGVVIGGTQDNNTLRINPGNQHGNKDASIIWTGDGFDCEYSTITKESFVSSQFNVLGKSSSGATTLLFTNNGPQQFSGAGVAPFHSVIRLWEDKNSTISLDSIDFDNDTLKVVLNVSDGTSAVFSGTYTKPQPNSKIVGGTVSFIDEVLNQVVKDEQNDGILRIDGDSVGTWDEATGKYKFKFNLVPNNKSNIKIKYARTFSAGDIVYLRSATDRIPFEYKLKNNIGVGDKLKIQDPVLSGFASVLREDIIYTREALKSGDKNWIRLNDLSFGNINGEPTSMEFSKDGNHLYVSTRSFGPESGGMVYRYSGLNKLSSKSDETDVKKHITRTVIFTQSQRVITGLCLHPGNNEKLLVTLGNYSAGTPLSHVFELENVETATHISGVTKRNVTGDLEDMPVYDAEYNMNDPKVVLIGTDFGVWSTPNINSANVNWFVENVTLANVPVFDIRQQRLGWKEAANHGVIYLGTHGRGIWSTSGLVSVEEPNLVAQKNDEISNMLIYPSPARNSATVKFDLDKEMEVDVLVYDITGKVVKSYLSRSFNQGEINFSIDVSDIPSGTYFATLSSKEGYSMTKFVVSK